MRASSSVSWIKRERQPDLAYVYTLCTAENTDKPVVAFLGGYRSDMSGTKAMYLEEQCRNAGFGYVRFDYRGHGQSEGVFDESTIGDWASDACAVLEHVGAKRNILVGSSMGGWMSLLTLRSMPERVAGVIGIAAAPDFSEEIFHERLNEEQRKTLLSSGFVAVPNDYSDEPYYYSRVFYEEAKSHLLLELSHDVDVPMVLIQGKQDVDVPWPMVERIQKAYASANPRAIYIDDGDHRLSRPEDLSVIWQEVEQMIAAI